MTAVPSPTYAVFGYDRTETFYVSAPHPLPPPSQLPPPSPPNLPGARTIYGLSLELTVSGDVASFDRQAFTESLARDLGVDASSVILTLRPGSVVVFAAIPYTTLPSFSDREIIGMSNAAASAAG